MTPTPVSPVPNTIRLATNERKTWVSELRSAKVGFQSGLVTGEKSIINWGIFIFALYAISWILPSSLVGFLRPLYLLNSLIFAPIAFSKAKIPIRWSFPIIFVMALQLWSFFTQAHAIAALGRIGALGRPELYLMEALVPCFVAYALVAVDPRARNPLMLMVLWAFGLSCFIAYAQFMRLGFAMRIAEAYTYKSIDNWDGAAGYGRWDSRLNQTSWHFNASLALGSLLRASSYQSLKLPTLLACSSLAEGWCLLRQEPPTLFCL